MSRVSRAKTGVGVLPAALRAGTLLSVLLIGCHGQIIGPLGAGTGDGQPGGTPPGAPPVDRLEGPPLRSPGASRLSRQELARSLRRLFGPGVPVDITLLPEDTLTPFDNDVLEQSPSMLLVEAMEAIGREIAIWTTSDPTRLAGLLPCTPASAGDATCFDRFVQGFGKRVLRRPLDQVETQEMRELLDYARTSGRFAEAVAMALRVLLLHPEFVYRVEPGISVTAGTTRLSGYETASRLSFLLQGMTPDDELLAAAGDGSLITAAGRRRQAERLLAAQEGKEQLRRFHAFWLGYARLDALPIQQKLRQETDALIDRATEPGRDYRHLLLAEETRIDAELANHYGMATGGVGGFDWVGYAGVPRRGILSHGLFAAAGAKFSDTSPTRRGKFIRERFLCQAVQLPPPSVNVDVDLPPMSRTPGACKIDRYREHREDPVCADCHALMDPIGFGLENFDELGRYRSHDRDRPECPIDGVGNLDRNTSFTGAPELANLIAESTGFGPCVAEFFVRFAAGRRLDEDDSQRAQWLGQQLEMSDKSFLAMMLAYVTHENFRYRQE